MRAHASPHRNVIDTENMLSGNHMHVKGKERHMEDGRLTRTRAMGDSQPQHFYRSRGEYVRD